MPSFQISDAPVRLDLNTPGPDGVTPVGRLAFTIRNMGPRAQAGRIRIEPTKGAEAAWLALAGAPDTAPAELELEFDYGGTHDVEAIVRPPAGAKPGSYGFRLRVVAESDPDVDVTQGPEVGFAVAAATVAPVVRSKIPWWAIAVAVVMVLTVGGAIFWLATRPAEVANAMPDVVDIDAGAASVTIAALNSGVTFALDGSGSLGALRVIRSDPEKGRKLTAGRSVALTVKAPPGACTSLICQFPGAEFPASELAKLAAVGFDSKYAPAVSRDGNRISVDEARLNQIASEGQGGGGRAFRCPPLCIERLNPGFTTINPDLLRDMESVRRLNPNLSIFVDR